MKTTLTLDRFEGDAKEIAVLLTADGAAVNLPGAMLPKGAKAGDVLVLAIDRDPGATRKVADRTRKVQDDLKKADPGGDITL